MMLSVGLIQTIFPRCRDPRGWVDALNPAIAQFGITTNARLSSFLAQTGYESGQFNRLVENLNYTSASRLMRVWPKRFLTAQSALPYVANEVRLANFVYANRLGNGDARSGDGYAFRGRGLIQVTGRSNFKATGEALDLNLIDDPDLLLEPAHAALSAAWFWSSRGLNELADDGTTNNDLEDFTEITRRINGGTVGLKDRLATLNQIEASLA